MIDYMVESANCHYFQPICCIWEKARDRGMATTISKLYALYWITW